MLYLIIFGVLIFGIIIGIVISGKYMDDRDFGTIKWVQSEDGPYLFLDMDKRPEEMQKYKYVVFKTDLKSPPRE